MKFLVSRSRILTPGAVFSLGLCLFLFLGLRTLEVAGQLNGVLASYGDDLVCLPLVLGSLLVVQRWWGGLTGFALSRWHGLSALVLFAVYFEAVLPLFRSGATADPRDVLAYTIGWLVFEIWVNRPIMTPEKVAA